MKREPTYMNQTNHQKKDIYGNLCSVYLTMFVILLNFVIFVMSVKLFKFVVF